MMDGIEILDYFELRKRAAWSMRESEPPEPPVGPNLELITTYTTDFTLPALTTAATTATVDWGDGTVVNLDVSASNNHTYAAREKHTIKITGVTELKQGAFLGNAKVSSAILHGISAVSGGLFAESVINAFESDATSIGFNALDGSHIVTASMPEATTVGNGVFYQCNALTTVYLPKITTISESMFELCTNLANLVVPATVTSIGNRALYGCNKTSNITYNGTTAQWAQITLGTSWNGHATKGKSVSTVTCTDGTVNL